MSEREILFRGKRVDNEHEWVYGNYHNHSSEKSISFFKAFVGTPMMMYAVIPDTVGQYTGLTDKNGTRIFEHDIIKIKYPFDELCNEVVSWSVEGARWNFGGVDAYFANPQKWAEVIGNVFDNPELLKGD